MPSAGSRAPTFPLRAHTGRTAWRSSARRFLSALLPWESAAGVLPLPWERAGERVAPPSDRLGQRRRRGAQRMRPGLAQLLRGSVSPQRAERVHAMVPRRAHVRAAVADHHRAGAVQPVMRQEVREQVALVLARAVELAAVHLDEMRREAES